MVKSTCRASKDQVAYFSLQSVIVKSSERNASNMYLARLAVLGLDRNENHAPCSTYTRSNINPCTPGKMEDYYGVIGYQTTPINGQSPPGMPSPIGTPLTTTTAWLQSNISPSSPTISNMMGGIMAAPMNQLLSCPPPLEGCGPAPPAPPPGLGPPNPALCASRVMSQYASSSTGSSDSYDRASSAGSPVSWSSKCCCCYYCYYY